MVAGQRRSTVSDPCTHAQAIADVRGKKQVVAVGEEAKMMLGRPPGYITASRPLRNGAHTTRFCYIMFWHGAKTKVIETYLSRSDCSLLLRVTDMDGGDGGANSFLTGAPPGSPA